MLTPEELYEGLNPETARQWREEAMNKYGKETIKKSEKALGKMGKEGLKDLISKQKENGKRLFALRSKDPTSREVQSEILEHFRIILEFWGKDEADPNLAEAYSGLGQLYLEDDRFTQIDGIAQPEYASFLANAMQHFAKTKLS